jgi:hypothetical protein
VLSIKKNRLVMGTALALPLLVSVGTAKAVASKINAGHDEGVALSSRDNSSPPIPLTGKQLDEITAGRESPAKPLPAPQPGDSWEVTSMAIGEEGGGLSPFYKYPL